MASLSGAYRAGAPPRADKQIREQRDEIVLDESRESGRPITQSRADVDDDAGIFEYVARQGRASYGDAFKNLAENSIKRLRSRTTPASPLPEASPAFSTRR
jgi:betaine-aldehyde dehydrogenase